VFLAHKSMDGPKPRAPSGSIEGYPYPPLKRPVIDDRGTRREGGSLGSRDQRGAVASASTQLDIRRLHLKLYVIHISAETGGPSHCAAIARLMVLTTR
jgi:hypothetical protein